MVRLAKMSRLRVGSFPRKRNSVAAKLILRAGLTSIPVVPVFEKALQSHQPSAQLHVGWVNRVNRRVLAGYSTRRINSDPDNCMNREEVSVERIRINTTVRGDLWEALGIEALKQRVDRNDILERLIEEYLKSRKKGGK